MADRSFPYIRTDRRTLADRAQTYSSVVPSSRVIGAVHHNNRERPFVSRTVDGGVYQPGNYDVLLSNTHPHERRPMADNTHSRHEVYMRYVSAHRELGANHPTTAYLRDALLKWSRKHGA